MYDQVLEIGRAAGEVTHTYPVKAAVKGFQTPNPVCPHIQNAGVAGIDDECIEFGAVRPPIGVPAPSVSLQESRTPGQKNANHQYECMCSLAADSFHDRISSQKNTGKTITFSGKKEGELIYSLVLKKNGKPVYFLLTGLVFYVYYALWSLSEGGNLVKLRKNHHQQKKEVPIVYDSSKQLYKVCPFIMLKDCVYPS